MCDEPMGVFGGLALGSLLGLLTGGKKTMTKEAAPVKEPRRRWRRRAFGAAAAAFTGVVLSAASAPGWLLLTFGVAAVALAAAGFALMRGLHRAVASPALTARLTGRPALPRAWQRQPLPRWNVVSVEKVPASQRELTGRVMAPGEKIGS